MFIWVVFLMVSENRNFLDSTILSKGMFWVKMKGSAHHWKEDQKNAAEQGYE